MDPDFRNILKKWLQRVFFAVSLLLFAVLFLPEQIQKHRRGKTKRE